MGETEFIRLELSQNKKRSVLALAVLFAFFSALLWKQQTIDFNIVLFHNFIYENTFMPGIFKLVSRYGMGFIAVLFSLLVFVCLKTSEKANGPFYLYMIFAFAFASISGDLLKIVFQRARPAVQLAGHITNTINSDSFAFPSGHATKSLALVLPFLLMAPNITINKIVKVPAFVVALLVAYSRIALQRHYLSDN